MDRYGCISTILFCYIYIVLNILTGLRGSRKCIHWHICTSMLRLQILTLLQRASRQSNFQTPNHHQTARIMTCHHQKLTPMLTLSLLTKCHHPLYNQHPISIKGIHRNIQRLPRSQHPLHIFRAYKQRKRLPIHILHINLPSTAHP